jgi:hypothetical protein
MDTTINENVLDEQEGQGEFDPGVEVEDTSTITEVKKPFDPKKIDIDTKNPTLDLIIKRLKSDPPAIDLYPDFQRTAGIWNIKNKANLLNRY